MRFVMLAYGYGLWLIPVLVLFYAYTFRRKRQALAVFAEVAVLPRLLPNVSGLRQWCKALCLVGAVGCLVLALMQPQWGKHWQEVQRQGRDMMILLDVSRSMLAEDLVPNRLARAKSDVKDLVRMLHADGGHRLGLIVFAGYASVQCPLTLDYAFFLQRLNEVSPDTVSRGGTLIGDAIRKALNAFGSEAHHYKDIILITDGEDHESFPLQAAQVAAEQHVSMYIIGLGDMVTGSRIPRRDAQGRLTYVQYQGQDVRSRLQESLLLEMAQVTGGAYVPAGTRAIELDRIYTEKIAPKARRHLDATTRERWVHQYQWFVALALVLLVVDMLLSERRTPASVPSRPVERVRV